MLRFVGDEVDDEQAPSFDRRPGIFLANEMPDNIKVAPLSDAAFRLLIRAWCYCSRLSTDGKIPEQVWREMGSAKARRELMAPPMLAPDRPPLVKAIPGGVECHDYLLHNRSADEVKLVAESKSEGGALGAHKRWHVGRRRFEKRCRYCREEGYVA